MSHLTVLSGGTPASGPMSFLGEGYPSLWSHILSRGGVPHPLVFGLFWVYPRQGIPHSPPGLGYPHLVLGYSQSELGNPPSTWDWGTPPPNFGRTSHGQDTPLGIFTYTKYIYIDFGNDMYLSTTYHSIKERHDMKWQLRRARFQSFHIIANRTCVPFQYNLAG